MRRSDFAIVPAFWWSAIIPLASALSPLTIASGASAAPYMARSSAGLASPDTVREAVGTPQIETSCPSVRVETASDTLNVAGPHMSRGVKVTLEKAGTGYRDTAVMDTLLLVGLQAAMQQCPMQKMNIVGDRYEQGEVGFVDIYGRLASDGPVVRLVHGDHFLGDMGIWARVVDEGAQLGQQAAAQAPAAPAPAPQVTPDSSEPRAVATPQQTVPSPVQAVPAVPAGPQKTFNDEVADFFAGVGRFIRNVLLILLAVWAFFKRAAIMRFVYGLTPHPAADEINEVMQSGQPYDPNRLARLLAVPPGNAIEREVRARQAADLLRNLTAHSARTREELEEETAYLKSQAGLADAMEMHARIKNRLDTILRMQGKTA